jgi:cardiolipin synthase
MNVGLKRVTRTNAEIHRTNRVLTVANALTVLRILMIAPFLYFVTRGRFGLALVIFLSASVTDFLDGYLARRLRQDSSLGRFLDPAADKLLTTASYVVLAIPRQGLPVVPVWLALAVVGRDVVILAGSLAVYLTRRFREFRPTLAGKINTAVELGVVTVFLALSGSEPLTSIIMPPLYWVVLATIIVSGLEYAIQGFRILMSRQPDH